jgi:hypothetical protein
MEELVADFDLVFKLLFLGVCLIPCAYLEFPSLVHVAWSLGG